jgi:hypothetical protein
MGILDKFFGPPSKDRFAKTVLKTLRAVGDKRNTSRNSSDWSFLRMKSRSAR